MPKTYPNNPKAYGDLITLLHGCDPGPWSVKVTSKMHGHDGFAYQATVYRDGVVVGDAYNDGNGGETWVTFNDDIRGDLQRGPTATAAREHAASQSFDLGGGTVVVHTLNSFLSVLAEASIHIAALRRNAVKRIVFMEDGRFFTAPKRDENGMAQFHAEHPKAIVLNAMLMEAV